MKNNTLQKILPLMLLLMWVSFTLLAQPGPGGDPVGDGGGTTGTSGTGVPLDGGVLSILLAAGIGYIVSIRRKKRK